MNWSDFYIDINSVVNNLYASGLFELGRIGVVTISGQIRKQIEKRKTKSFLRKTIPDQLDEKLLNALKTIHPAQFKSGYKNLFNDDTFRRMLLNWMFTIRIEEKNKSFSLIQEYSEKKIGKEQSEPILLFVTNVYLQTIASDPVLSSILIRADHSKIIDAIHSEGFKIRLEIEDIAVKLDEVLTKLDIIALDKTQDDVIQNRAREYSRSIINSISIQIPIIGYIEKDEIEIALDLAIERKNVLVLGEAGSGKTGVLTKIGTELLNKFETVLFISADRIAAQIDSKCTIEDLSKSIAVAPDRNITEIIDLLKEKSKRLWLIIDQLDEVAGHSVGGALHELITAYSNQKKLHIIAACRSYEALYSSEFSTLTLDSFYVGNLSPESTYGFIKKLGVEPTNEICSFCSNLLNLSLLAFLVESSEHSPTISSEISLWFHYRNEIEKRVEGALKKISLYAIEALLSRTNSFNSSNDRIANKLASFGLFVRISADRFRFKHERIRDYFIAYDFIIIKEKGIVELLNEIDPVRSKNIIPWMIQIADYENTNITEQLLIDTFNDKIINNGFVLKSIINSISLISKPTPLIGATLWKTVNSNAKLAYEVFEQFKGSHTWADSFWEAKIFQLASIEYESNEKHSEPVYYLYDLLEFVSPKYIDELIDWIRSLNRPPQVSKILQAIVNFPADQLKQCSRKIIEWLSVSNDVSASIVNRLIKNLIEIKEKKIATEILALCLEPIAKEYKYSNRPHLTPRCREYNMFDHYFVRQNLKLPWDVDEFVLAKIINKHIVKIHNLAKESNFPVNWKDNFNKWGNVDHLISSKRNSDEDWTLWYGLLATCLLIGAQKDLEKTSSWILKLSSTKDLIKTRIALRLLSELDFVPINILSNIIDKGILRNPETIPEAIRLLDYFNNNNNKEFFKILICEINIAIGILDRSRHYFYSIEDKNSLLKWSYRYLLSKKTNSLEKDSPKNNVAKFIFFFQNTRNKKLYRLSDDKLIKASSILALNPFKLHGYVVGPKGKPRYDITDEYHGLHDLHNFFNEDFVINKFKSFVKENNQINKILHREPFGYILLYYYQLQLEKDKTLRIKEFLEIFEDCIDDNSKYSPAIRSQFAGALSLMLQNADQNNIKPYLEIILKLSTKLIKCNDIGCVLPMRGKYPSCYYYHQIPSTKSTILYGLIQYYWNLATSKTEFNKIYENARKKLENIQTYKLSDTEQIIADSFQFGINGNTEIISVLGYCFNQLYFIYPVLSISILYQITNSHKDLIETFALHAFHNSNSKYFYNYFKPIYNHFLEKESIPEGVIEHAAWAYLHDIEDIEDSKSIFSKLLYDDNEEIISSVIESVCNFYDSHGVKIDHWDKIVKLWEGVYNKIGEEPNELYAAFGRCFERGQRGIGVDSKKIKSHIPCKLDKCYDLVRTVCLNISKAKYRVKERKQSIVDYLASQCLGKELIVIELLSSLIGLESDDYDKYAISSKSGIKILQYAIKNRGKSKEIATKIIEKHEKETSDSLAGLLL